MLVRPPLAELRRYLSAVRPLLEPAIGDPARGGYEDVERLVLDGTCELWVIVSLPPPLQLHAAVVTRVVSYPRSRSLLIELCGGYGMADWKGLIREFEAYARQRGCQHVEIRGRRGWERVFEAEGYTFVLQLIAKEV